MEGYHMTHPVPARALLFGFFCLSLVGTLPGRAEVRQLTDNNRYSLSPAINRAGQAVWLERVIGTPRARLCLWTGSSLQQLTGEQESVGSFLINDAGEVAWETTGAMGPQVYLWDGAVVRQLSSGSVGSCPQLNASGQVFWIGGCRPDKMGPDVYMWDGATARRLTTRGQWIDSLQVNRVGQAVWRSWDGEDLEIYVWDGTEVRQLSDSHFDDWEPQINNRGQVVWSGGSTDPGLLAREIYFWTGSAVRQITHNRLLDSQPQLNDAGQITWRGADLHHAEIYLWDGDRIRQLTENSQDNQNPRISQAGQVVWESVSAPNSNLFLWDGSAVRQLTHDNPRNGYAWDMNDDGQVVWHAFDGRDTEIDLWNGSIVVQLTNNSRFDEHPRINAAGQVVWHSADFASAESEIYEYTPDTSGSLVVDPLRILGSRSPTGTVFLAAPAPEGGAVVTLTSDHPDLVTVPASVTIPAGGVNAPFPVTTAAVTETTPVQITASYGGATWTATLTLVPVTLSSIYLCANTVAGGMRASGVYRLSDPATPGGTIVTFTSSDPTIARVPPSQTLMSPFTGAGFGVLTAPVTAPTPVVITVSCGGVTRTATLTVLPSAVDSLSVTPEILAGGGSATGVVTLTSPAPPGGAVVTLASDPAGAAAVPESLVVPPGATTAAFPIATRRVLELTPVAVTATCGGVSQTATLRVWPTTLASISLETRSVTGGVPTSGRVELTAPAPGGGTIVTLASDTPGLASVPGTVLVPAGETSASFRVITRPAKAIPTVMISASLAQASRIAPLMILPIGLAAVAVRPGAVTGGTQAAGTILLSGPAPAGGALVILMSTSAAAAVPVSVIVPEGTSKATFPVTTSAVTQDQWVVLFATYGGVTQTTRLAVRRKR
jgi:hypothetical protein